MYVKTVEPKQQPAPKVITELDMVEKLRGYALERQYALNQYTGGYYHQEKLKVIDDIILILDEAKSLEGGQIIKKALKTALFFHYIAPSKMSDFKTWHDKIESAMTSCREYLGWRSQKSA